VFTLNIFKRVNLGLLFSVFTLRYHRQGAYRNRDYESLRFRYSGPQPALRRSRRRLPKLLIAFIAFLIVFVIAVSIYVTGLYTMTQSYLEVHGDIKVAQVRIIHTGMLPHNMTVRLTLFDKDGHPFYDQNYINNNIAGDNLLLRGDIITFSPLLNLFGLHEEFKLTSSTGHYQDSRLESAGKPDAMPIDGGDDNFFQSVLNGNYPGVTASYSNSVTLPADGNTYDVFMSQNGLFIRPEK
jgi:hypothetical protein